MSAARRLRALVARVAFDSHVLVALHVCFLSISAYLYTQAAYVDRTFDYIAARVTTPAMTQREKAVALLHATHDLLEPREKFFEGRRDHGAREDWFHAADFALIEARGACGAYSQVFAQALEAADIDIRIAQMMCAHGPGCHIVVEANIEGRWVVMDAAYDTAFENPDGTLATFGEIGADFPTFRKQLPPNYDDRFAYAGVRYTNWDKVPVLMPALKAVLGLFMGQHVDEVCLRSYVLDPYAMYLKMVLGAWAVTAGITSVALVRRRSRSRSKKLAHAV
jgi:hypothetical protein